MRQVFFLVVVLIGVIAAMFVLKKKAEQGRGDGGAPQAGVVPVAEGGGGNGGLAVAPVPMGGDGGTMRVVALTRLIPRYAVALPATEPAELRGKVLELLLRHGGRATGALPSDPRAPFAAEVPHKNFKKLLRDLGGGSRPVLVTPRGEVPHGGGPAVVVLELSLPAPLAAP